MPRVASLSRSLSLALVMSSLAGLGGIAAADRMAPAPYPVPSPIEGAPRFARPPMDPTVEQEPLAIDRGVLRARLIENRAANLARFRAYVRTGVFPSNTMSPDRKNVWRDDDGHFCAAATIIRKSGNIALVDRVADQNNFIRLADVQQGPLMDWILTSGLTQEEIVAIQEPFMPVSKRPNVKPVDPDMRTAEDARLLKRYATVDAQIVKDQKRSIEIAVDRLSKHQALAWKVSASREPRS